MIKESVRAWEMDTIPDSQNWMLFLATVKYSIMIKVNNLMCFFLCTDAIQKSKNIVIYHNNKKKVRQIMLFFNELH